MISDWLEDLGSMTGELEADAAILETIILNSENEKANIYLRESIVAINRALSSMSDALLEITTSHVEDSDF